MFPSGLWQVLIEREVDASARLLFACLFLHAETDTAGFIAWQPKQLGTLTGLSPEHVERASERLHEKRLLCVDREMERAWLVPFIEYDSSRKPNMYVSAMRSIRVCSSRPLKGAAWAEVQRIHPPPLKLKDSTPEETRVRLVAEREAAYEELEESVRRDTRTVREPFGNRSGTVREPLPNPLLYLSLYLKEVRGHRSRASTIPGLTAMPTRPRPRAQNATVFHRRMTTAGRDGAERASHVSVSGSSRASTASNATGTTSERRTHSPP